MLRLRPYKNCDAKYIVSWIKDEVSLRKWSSDRYETYPITPEDMNKKYVDGNGDCEEEDNFYPKTAYDENSMAGHLILRFTDKEKRVIRFGFVIVDDTKRGKGYGKEMLQLAVRFAFDMLKAEKITLGVFENNPAAHACYKAVGFKDIASDEPWYYRGLGEAWKVIEMELLREDECVLEE